MPQKQRSASEAGDGRSADETDAVVRGIVKKYGGRRRAVIQILQDLQDRFRWLPPETLEATARELDVPLAHVYSVATFYKSFSLEPRGRHLCTVCMGTACHVRGGAAILEQFERKLGLRAGETSTDQRIHPGTGQLSGGLRPGSAGGRRRAYYGQMNAKPRPTGSSRHSKGPAE